MTLEEWNALCGMNNVCHSVYWTLAVGTIKDDANGDFERKRTSGLSNTSTLAFSLQKMVYSVSVQRITQVVVSKPSMDCLATLPVSPSVNIPFLVIVISKQYYPKDHIFCCAAAIRSLLPEKKKGLGLQKWLGLQFSPADPMMAHHKGNRIRCNVG